MEFERADALPNGPAWDLLESPSGPTRSHPADHLPLSALVVPAGESFALRGGSMPS